MAAIDYAVLYNKLIMGELGSDDRTALIKDLEKTAKKIQKQGLLEPDQMRCLSILLWSTGTLSEMQTEVLEYRSRLSLAKKILRTKATDEKRMREALSVFDLSLKEVSSQKTEEMKNLYLFLIQQNGIKINSKTWALPGFAYNGKDFEISWTNETTKRKAILSFIRAHFDEPSIKSVAKRLERAGVRNLIGH